MDLAVYAKIFPFLRFVCRVYRTKTKQIIQSFLVREKDRERVYYLFLPSWWIKLIIRSHVNKTIGVDPLSLCLPHGNILDIKASTSFVTSPCLAELTLNGNGKSKQLGRPIHCRHYTSGHRSRDALFVQQSHSVLRRLLRHLGPQSITAGRSLRYADGGEGCGGCARPPSTDWHSSRFV